MVVVAKPSIATLPPRVEASVLQDAGTVGRPAGSVHHSLSLQCINEVRCVDVSVDECLCV